MESRDTMESKFAIQDLMVKKGLIFSTDPNAKLVHIMNGLPLKCLPNGLYIANWLYYIFSPFTAVLVNFLLVHIIGFLGMYYLLKNHFLKKEEDLYIVYIGALCFAILPHFMVYGLSSSGMPLLFNAFFNLRKEKPRWYNYLIILIFPLYTSFIQAGIFALICLFLFFIADCWKRKKINYYYLLALIILSISYLLVEWKLVYATFFDKDFVSSRTSYCNGLLTAQNYKLVFGYGTYKIFTETFWVAACSPVYIIFTLPFAAFIAFRKKEYNLLKWLIILLGFVLFFSVMHSVWYWDVISVYRQKLGIFKSLDWRRFHMLFPVFWYMLFAVSLMIISRIKYGKYIVLFIFLVQIQAILWDENRNVEFNQNVKILTGKPSKNPSYKQFFSKRMFTKIRDDINQPQEDYRIVGIGIPPAVANYNGFCTLDGYQDNYPVQYKYEFRKIMAKELEKNEGKKKFFDCWGAICYILPAELRQETADIVSKGSGIKLHNLELDIEQFKKMGGEYILSSVEILNYKQTGLNFVRFYEDDESMWEIYLYKAL